MATRPKVFISHKNEDSNLAVSIADRLKTQHSIDVYLDVIDKRLNEDGVDLAEYISARLEECSQLLAVMTQRTQISWWVPWEIGVATEKRRFLASYVEQLSSLPEYLRKWPYLRTLSDLDKYAEESKRGVRLLEEQLRTHTAGYSQNYSFRSFSNNLKRSLGQS